VKEEVHTFWLKCLKKRDDVGDFGTDRSIRFKQIVGKLIMNWIEVAENRV
jgi:hypothetical protein